MSLSIFNQNIKKDIYGFYLCGGLKFHSKVEAMEFSQISGKPLYWNYNDEVFSLCDWTKEPADSITELYRKRAQQLRDNYDYLVLLYSSGSDSDNILKTFIDNNIKLDEVVSMINYEASKDKLSKLNAEIFEIAIPTIKECQKKQPQLKHRIHDITSDVIEKYSSLDLNYLYEQNVLYTNFHSTLHEIRKKVYDWNEKFNSGKRVAFIMGIDKPKLDIDFKGNLKFKFGEPSVSSAISAKTMMENNPWEFNELFYWSPDFPEIAIKQAHIVKNFFKRNGLSKFKKNPFTKGTFTLQPPQGAFIIMYLDSLGERFWLTNEDLNSMIYPYWYKKPYQYKTISNVFYDKDDWFNNLSMNEQIKKNWWATMQKILEFTNTNPLKDSLHIKPVVCKLYNLEN
jgi:hypothetical protein